MTCSLQASAKPRRGRCGFVEQGSCRWLGLANLHVMLFWLGICPGLVGESPRDVIRCGNGCHLGSDGGRYRLVTGLAVGGQAGGEEKVGAA